MVPPDFPPGINLPMATFCRSKFGDYKEYHTSLDNLKLVNEKNLKDSLLIITNIIKSFELGIYPKLNIVCEPMMSKRNLYPFISKVGNYSQNIKDRMNFIAYCDGRDIFEISLKTGIKLEKLIYQVKKKVFEKTGTNLELELQIIGEKL